MWTIRNINRAEVFLQQLKRRQTALCPYLFLFVFVNIWLGNAHCMFPSVWRSEPNRIDRLAWSYSLAWRKVPNLARAVFLVRLWVVTKRRSARLSRLVLDTRFGRVQIEPAVLDALVDLAGRFQECFFNVLAAKNKKPRLHYMLSFTWSFPLDPWWTHVIALASANKRPCSSAKLFASSYVTSRVLSRSDLLPIRNITVLGFVRLRVSVSQLDRWL